MITKRWLQLQRFLSSLLLYKPIWEGSLIIVPRNRLIGWLKQYVDEKCRVRALVRAMWEWTRCWEKEV